MIVVDPLIEGRYRGVYKGLEYISDRIVLPPSPSAKESPKDLAFLAELLSCSLCHERTRLSHGQRMDRPLLPKRVDDIVQAIGNLAELLAKVSMNLVGRRIDTGSDSLQSSRDASSDSRYESRRLADNRCTSSSNL